MDKQEYKPLDHTDRPVPILRESDGRLVGQVMWNANGNGVTFASLRPPLVLHRVDILYSDVDGIMQEDVYLEVRGLRDSVRLQGFSTIPRVH